MHSRSSIKRFVVVAVLATSPACGGHASPTAPTNAWSAISSAPAPMPTRPGATIVGTVSGVSAAASGMRALSSSNITVTVAGTDVSAVVDFSGGFTLMNVPPGEVVLQFSGPGIDAALPLGAVEDSDHLQIGVTISSTSATLTSQVSTTPTSPTVTVKGIISRIAGACPSLALTIGDTSVKTSASTTFTEKGCAEIAGGDKAEVVGAKQSDDAVLATTIAVAKTVTPPPAPTPVTVSGAISALDGTCPALKLKVDGTYVTTSNATTFSGRICGDVKSGDKVEAVGTKQSDGVVLATTISVK